MQGSPTLSKQTSPTNQTLGHYQILREAGRGGMSMVYEAKDIRIGRRVALKVLSVPLSLPPEQAEAMIARLKREARAIARLSHPNIVSIYDIGEDNGQHFIVMEFLEGVTLRERLSQEPIVPAAVADILDQVALGLDAVHAADIIHRDIKPSNVMLLPNGLVKLMDFGVARQQEDTMVTQAGTMVGSPTYMAPEQIQGESYSAASDIWSLGVILYEMFAGRSPFAGDNIPHILYQVTQGNPPPVSGTTPAMEAVLHRALDKDPARRYRSASDLAAAFRAALASSPASKIAPVLPPLAAHPRSPRISQASGQPLALAQSRPRLVLAQRPIAWAAGLLLLTLLVALPQALRPKHVLVSPKPVARRSSAPFVAQRVPTPTEAVSATPTAPASVPALTHSQMRVAASRPKTRPTVRVAAFRQTRTFRHTRRISAARAPVASTAHVPSANILPARPHRGERLVKRYQKETLPKITAREPGYSRRRNSRIAPNLTPHDGLPIAVPTINRPAQADTGAGPNMLGTWHGTHSHNHATLVITHREGNTFAGTMNVRTHEATVRVAVSGRISPRTGEVSMHETRVLSSSKPRAWDLGSESGHVAGSGRISGQGTDVKGRSGAWSFSR